MEHTNQNMKFPRPNSLTTSSATSLRDLSVPTKHDRFQRDIYLPSTSYFKSNIETRMKEKEKEIKDEENNNTKNEENETIPKLIRHFLGYTSAHGIGRLADKRTLFWKIFWSIVCLGSFGMFSYQAHGLFMIYISRPVTTTVRITFEKQVPFPAVTICNLNMIRADMVPQVVKKEISKTYEKYNISEDASQSRKRRDLAGGSYSTTTQKPILNYNSSTTKKPLINTKATTSKDSLIPYHQTTSSPTTNNYYSPRFNRYSDVYSTSYNPYVTSYNPYDNDYSNYYYYGGNYRYQDDELLPSRDQMDEQTQVSESFATVVTHVPEAILKQSGHQFDDLITNCSWRGLECKKSNFSNWWSQSWDYKYGNCYTFNGGIDKNHEPIRVLSTSKPGPSQGLLLRLNIEQNKYLKTITSEAGARVILHDQGVMSFPFQEGFSVSPAMSTSIGIQTTVISRVDRFSNNTCWDINELDEKNIYRMHRNITKYTQQTCQNSCLGISQFEDCGCSEYAFPSEQPACDSLNDTIRLCLQKVYIRFMNDAVPCLADCRQACSENVIQKTISMSQWPSSEYESFERSKDTNFSPKDIVMLNIFYNELNYQRIEETFTYDEINLLADIGGQLGLWIGVSVITCFETLELFILIVTHIVRKSHGSVGNGNAVDP